MKLAAIVAMTEDRVIGKDNQLLWHIPEDLKRFKSLTTGHHMIMGRRTFQSLGRLLPNRVHVVLTRDPDFQHEGVVVARSMEDALAICQAETAPDEPVFVIGGGEIFRAALPYCECLYVTWVHHQYQGDAHFPDIDLKADFNISENTHYQSEGRERLNFSYVTYERVSRSDPQSHFRHDLSL